MNKREIDMLQAITQAKRFDKSYTIHDLMERFGVSERTIRYDLEAISTFLLDEELEELSINHEGLIIQPNAQEKIEQVLRHQDFYTLHLSREQRAQIILTWLVSNQDIMTLQTLADRLMVSRSTIVKDIQVSRQYALEAELEIVSYPKGIQVEGKESAKRWWLIRQADEIVSQEHFNHLIAQAELANEMFLTDESFQALVNYFSILLMRVQSGNQIEVDYVLEHPGLEATANRLFDQLENQYGLKRALPEVYFLADLLYNLNYLKRNDTDDKLMVNQVITKRFIDTLSLSLGMSLQQDFQLYQNLVTHLQSLFRESRITADVDTLFLKELVSQQKAVSEVVNRHVGMIEEAIGRPLQEDEKVYLVLHVAAAIQRNKNRHQSFSAVMVCNAGIATAQLLLSNLKKYFRFEVADVIPKHALESYDLSAVDIILTTVPLEKCEQETILVHPQLTDEDYLVIGKKLESIEKKNTEHQSFVKLQNVIAKAIDQAQLDKDDIYQHVIREVRDFYFPEKKNNTATLAQLLQHHIQLDIEAHSWQEAIQKSAQKLLDEQVISEVYVEKMIETVEVNGSYIVLAPGFALPHEAPQLGSTQLAMNLIRLKEPVYFPGNQQVDLICTLATIDKNAHLRAMFHLMNMLSNPSFLQGLRQAKTEAEMYRLIYHSELML